MSARMLLRYGTKFGRGWARPPMRNNICKRKLTRFVFSLNFWPPRLRADVHILLGLMVKHQSRLAHAVGGKMIAPDGVGWGIAWAGFRTRMCSWIRRRASGLHRKWGAVAMN